MGKNSLKLETKGFEELLEKLDGLEVNLIPVVEDALSQAAETITEDTIEAMSTGNLPAGGKFSTGDTKDSINTDTSVRWNGMQAEVWVGFDFSKLGAGGYLITGTPRMKPNQKLKKIYKSKRYMKQIEQDMVDIFNDAIEDYMGG